MGKIKVIKDDKMCKPGSLLEHWKRHSKDIMPKYCIVSTPDCLHEDLVGVRVQKAGSADKKEYVVPLCRKHSESEEELEINDLYTLVPLHLKNLLDN